MLWSGFLYFEEKRILMKQGTLIRVYCLQSLQYVVNASKYLILKIKSFL